MYKQLADSTLMHMTKQEIIEQLRIAEHNYFTTKETNNVQYENCKRLLAEERNKAIDDYMNKLCSHCMQQKNECYILECPFCSDGCDIISVAEQLKNCI